MNSMSDTRQQLEASLCSALESVIGQFSAESGTIHVLGGDGMLHLKASVGIPEPVLNLVRIVPIGKGMAGLAVQRREPITICNIQTDASGDVRPGAKKTGMEGAIVVPIFDDGNEVVGTLGIANRNERTFTETEIERLIECGREIAQSFQ
jgi:L-methionine (R)-S-oxide reductase